MNIQSAVNEGTTILKNSYIKTFKLDTEILMAKALGSNREYIILNNKKILNNDSLDYFKRLIKERASGKPIAYLTNKKFFWDYEFYINKNTLIPRPDTEIIVEESLRLTKHKDKINVLDIGVGSGCILLTILKERKNFYGTGIDISKKSLDISKINAKSLNIESRVKFYKTDIDKFVKGKYDLVVSNPPYIKSCDLKYLDRDVVDFEPITALDGGTNGLSNILKVINKSSALVKINGKLVLEIGFGQKNDVKKILVNRGFYINKIVKDYSNNDRCIISTKL